MRMKCSDFSVYLSEFLTVHLPFHRGYSKNTIKSYRDTFKQILLFFDEKKIKPEKITMAHFTQENVLEFLGWLNRREISISTVNNRLAAIKSFLHFVIFSAPENIYSFQRIFEIPFKKNKKKLIPSLSVEQVKRLLATPKLSSKKGLRDLTLLSVLYDTGARVQELIDLKVQDFCSGVNPFFKLMGKGNKSRKVPVTIEVSKLVQKYMDVFSLNDPNKGLYPLFFNNRNEKLTRSGVTYILNKYVKEARITDSSIPKHVHCHMLRHSKAFHLLQAGISLPYIQDFLGHSDIATTQIYAHASLEMKVKAINKAYPTLVEDRPIDWTEQPQLMQFLESLG